jgi:polyphenol oxidase
MPVEIGKAWTDRLLRPDWRAPAGVHAFTTLRAGGVSRGAWGAADGQGGGMNVSLGCGDDPRAVLSNRGELRRLLPAEPLWLHQVHGCEVLDADEPDQGGLGEQGGCRSEPQADAAVTTRANRVLAVLTADCMAVLLTDEEGSVVGAAHAGWRGLAGGVLEATVARMREVQPQARAIRAHLGPAIGPRAFEVGDEVRQAFCDLDAGAQEAFVPGLAHGKWVADLYALARRRLQALGVGPVTGGSACTFSDAQCFYSFRRDRTTGRMATLIWREGPGSTLIGV